MKLTSKQKRRALYGFQTEREQSMADRIQLKEPGSELVMTVRTVKPETVEKNDYYLFSNGAKELLVPQSTVKGRLDHLEIASVDEMIGESVRFARSMKMSRANKPFWDLDWAPSGAENGSAGGDSGKPTTGTSASAPSAEPPAKRPTIREAYKQLTEWVISDIAPLYHNDASFDASVAASITATLFIQACKAGKVE